MKLNIRLKPSRPSTLLGAHRRLRARRPTPRRPLHLIHRARSRALDAHVNVPDVRGRRTDDGVVIIITVTAAATSARHRDARAPTTPTRTTMRCGANRHPARAPIVVNTTTTTRRQRRRRRRRARAGKRMHALSICTAHRAHRA